MGNNKIIDFNKSKKDRKAKIGKTKGNTKKSNRKDYSYIFKRLNRKDCVDTLVLAILSLTGLMLYMFSKDVTIVMLPTVLFCISLFSHIVYDTSIIGLIYTVEDSDEEY